MNLDQRLIESERINDFFLNTTRTSTFQNRLEKLLSRPYRYPAQLFYKAIKANSDKSVEMFWGEHMTLPLRDQNAITIYFSGSLGKAESGVARFFIHTLKPGGVFYDVGANMGYYSSLGVYLQAQVHAFEPNPSVINYTRKNASGAIVNEVALSSSTGEAEFFDIAASNKSAMSSMFQEAIPVFNQKTQVVRTVKTITLDSYVQTHPVPSVIKIDVENAEALVLQGAISLLSEYSPKIVMEVDNRPSSLERTATALSILANSGYRSYEILEDGFLVERVPDLTSSKIPTNFCFQK